MSKPKKDIFITKSDSWAKISNTDINKVLSDTIIDYGINVKKIINVQLITNSVGTMQFYIYHK